MDLRSVVNLSRRTSLSLVPAARSIWILGEFTLQFDAARRCLRTLAEGRPDLCLLFSSANPATMRYLSACYQNDQASSPPLASKTLIKRFFRMVNPGLLVLLEGGRTVDVAVLLHSIKAGLPITLLNITLDEEINPLIIDRARSGSGQILFCVQDTLIAQRLQDQGIAPQQITVTGSLDLEPDRPSQRVPRPVVRSLLGMDDVTPLIVAGAVPAQETTFLLDAFATVRQWEPSIRLIVEPADAESPLALLDQVRERGWRPARRVTPAASIGAESWDVLLAEVPGELPALFRAADVAIAGGTFGERLDAGSLATALGAGCAAVAGRGYLSSTPGSPWLAHDRRLLFTDASDLGGALRQALHITRSLNDAAQNHPCQEPHRGAADRTAQALKPLLPAKPAAGPEGHTWRVPTARDRVADGRLWKTAAPWFMKRRVNDWQTLKDRLQRPRSILCVGNGPSCEDPRLAGVDHDCLMRVNWRWRDRNFLTQPHLVFIGDYATVHRVSNCLFGIWNEFLEYRMLLRRLTRRGPRRIEYITMSRLPGVMQARPWTVRPSNGALMIVAAVALQPERITIGGMDLFAHPDGRYPGDIRSRNEYSRVHTLENELAMINLALADFRGEVVILSDILRDSLGQYREIHREETVGSGSVAL